MELCIAPDPSIINNFSCYNQTMMNVHENVPVTDLRLIDQTQSQESTYEKIIILNQILKESNPII